MKNRLIVILFLLISINTQAKNFTFRELAKLPRSGGITEDKVAKYLPKDVKDWTRPKDIFSENTTFVAQGKTKFTIISGPESTEGAGDAARYKFKLKKPNGEIENFQDRWLAFVYITSDEKYVIYETLGIVNTESWKHVEVPKMFLDVLGYVNVLKYSPSSERLILKSSECMADCRDLSDVLYEVQLP